MASLSDDNNSNLNDEAPLNNEEEEVTEESEETKSENTSQNENTGIDLFGSIRPVNICSPLNVSSSHKPVFGASRSILKPSTLFTDASTSMPPVTFGNNISKTVKLKPSVLANPFVNNEFSKSFDSNSKANCDEKSDKLPQSETNPSSEDTNNTMTAVPPKFVPLNGPSTTSSVSLAVTTSATTSSTPAVSNAVSSSTSNSTSVSTEFVFGQNLHERVTIENDSTQQPQEPVTQNGSTFSEMLFTSAIKQESVNAKQKDGGSHEFSNGNAKTLSVSAKEYEEARSVKRKYEEVAVVTGEEDEQNVLQINCKLFTFDNASTSWTERGRGTLRVNDKETSEGRNSRLVMRLLGNLRLVLNTKIWSDMSVEHVSKKSVRLTAIDYDGQVRIYLVMASPKDSEQLYNVLSSRIAKKKLKMSAEESTSTSSAKVE